MDRNMDEEEEMVWKLNHVQAVNLLQVPDEPFGGTSTSTRSRSSSLSEDDNLIFSRREKNISKKVIFKNMK